MSKGIWSQSPAELFNKKRLQSDNGLMVSTIKFNGNPGFTSICSGVRVLACSVSPLSNFIISYPQLNTPVSSNQKSSIFLLHANKNVGEPSENSLAYMVTLYLLGPTKDISALKF